MTLQGSIPARRKNLYVILFLLAIICYGLLYSQRMYPLGKRALRGHELLAMQSDGGCSTCDTVDYYRHPEKGCTIKQVITTGKEPYKVLSIESYDIAGFLAEKTGKVHTYPVATDRLFAQRCYDLGEGTSPLPPQ